MCSLFESIGEALVKGPSARTAFPFAKASVKNVGKLHTLLMSQVSMCGNSSFLPRSLPSVPIRPVTWQHMTLLTNNVRGMSYLNSFSE